MAVFAVIGLAVGGRVCMWWVYDADFQGDEEKFFDAVQYGDLEKAKRLFAQDSSRIHAKDRYGRTPLFIAVSGMKNETEMAAWLIEVGADVNAAETNGFTPLYWAAFDGNVALVDLLLASGASVDVKTNDGKTPLYVAPEKGFVDIVTALAHRGADVNVASKEGWTPLHLAARQGKKDLVDSLLAWGADPRAQDIALQTPLQDASSHGHTDIVALLMARDPEAQDPRRSG